VNACDAPEVNAFEKTPARFDRDEWTHYFGSLDPTLDPTSLALAHASVIAFARPTGLIDRPRDLIETPR
jgi:hypothetical protein